MILSAGLGTRLRPLTDDRPKAMVELKGKTLLEHVICKMKQAGVDRIVVNVHHYADMIIRFLDDHHNFGMDIVISDERDCLLDTGGGLLKARELFRPAEPVMIHNVDILSDINLGKLMTEHLRRDAYATLVVRPCEGGRVLKFNEQGILKGWENQATGEQKIVDDTFYTAADYSFCGVHIVSPAYLHNMVYRGVFSIIDEYITQARQHDMYGFSHTGMFLDLGTPEAIHRAEQQF